MTAWGFWRGAEGKIPGRFTRPCELSSVTLQRASCGEDIVNKKNLAAAQAVCIARPPKSAQKPKLFVQPTFESLPRRLPGLLCKAPPQVPGGGDQAGLYARGLQTLFESLGKFPGQIQPSIEAAPKG